MNRSQANPPPMMEESEEENVTFTSPESEPASEIFTLSEPSEEESEEESSGENLFAEETTFSEENETVGEDVEPRTPFKQRVLDFGSRMKERGDQAKQRAGEVIESESLKKGKEMAVDAGKAGAMAVAGASWSAIKFLAKTGYRSMAASIRAIFSPFGLANPLSWANRIVIIALWLSIPMMSTMGLGAAGATGMAAAMYGLLNVYLVVFNKDRYFDPLGIGKIKKRIDQAKQIKDTLTGDKKKAKKKRSKETEELGGDDSSIDPFDIPTFVEEPESKSKKTTKSKPKSKPKSKKTTKGGLLYKLPPAFASQFEGCEEYYEEGFMRDLALALHLHYYDSGNAYLGKIPNLLEEIQSYTKSDPEYNNKIKEVYEIGVGYASRSSENCKKALTRVLNQIEPDSLSEE